MTQLLPKDVPCTIEVRLSQKSNFSSFFKIFHNRIIKPFSSCLALRTLETPLK